MASPALLLSTLTTLTSGISTISSDQPFIDDFSYTDISFTSEDQWYNPGSGHLSNLTGPDDLGSVQTPCDPSWCGDEGLLWGWWTRWGESSVEEDPARQMQREFRCSSKAIASFSLSVFACITNAGSKTSFYAQRWIHSGESTHNLLEYKASQWALVSEESVLGCTNGIRKHSLSDTFAVNAGQIVSVTISQTLEGALWGSKSNAIAFNNFSFSCETIATAAPTPTLQPTLTPTMSTDEPSATPTMEPTLEPTLQPSTEPSGTPTMEPTTATPTQTPTTKTPTQTPTRTPITDEPTTNPTFAPTLRPSEGPTRNPTQRPTESVNMFVAAFGGGEAQCEGVGVGGVLRWIECHWKVFCVLCGALLLCLVWCCLGSVWYRRRQSMRKIRKDGRMAVSSMDVEMAENHKAGRAHAVHHATADKWKSQWEREQEAKWLRIARE